MNDHKRTLVTCALPYANGPVHIGHLAGAYIPGDIYVRYLRMRGEDVVFICGSDEHGVPITIKARAQGGLGAPPAHVPARPVPGDGLSQLRRTAPRHRACGGPPR